MEPAGRGPSGARPGERDTDEIKKRFAMLYAERLQICKEKYKNKSNETHKRF